MNIKEIARLAMIKFEDEELSVMEDKLNTRIKEFNEINQECECEPFVYMTENNNIFREDIEKPFEREILFDCALNVQDGYFQVPKVIE